MKLSRLGSATLPDVFEATRVDANPESARALRVTLDAFAERSCRTLSNEKENSAIIDLWECRQNSPKSPLTFVWKP